MDVAKYWKGGCIVEGGPPLKSRVVPLNELCGRYEWIWDEDDNCDRVDNGFITFNLREGTDATPEHVFGSIRIGSLHGSFRSLKPIPNCIEYPNWWDLGDDRWSVEEGGYEHSVGILDVMDDNGSPFVTLEYDRGRQTWVTFIGKKKTSKNEKVTLTDAERERLGMHLEYEEAEELWRNGIR